MPTQIGINDDNERVGTVNPLPTTTISSVLSPALAAILAGILAAGATAILILNAVNGVVSDGNSTSTPLGISETFTGESVSTLDEGIIYINVATDKESAEDGLKIEQSSDGTNWDHDDSYTVAAGSSKNYSVNPHAEFLRVVYTNGTEAQGYFRLQTIIKSNALPSSHRIQDDVTNDDDAELIEAILKVQTNDKTKYRNVDVQNPLPIDGDSVYGKDLLLSESDEGGFVITGSPSATSAEILTSMVSDVWIEKKDSSATNPKIVTLAFRRPVLSTSFGIDSGPLGDFSNVKVYIKQGQTEFLVIDESADDTKYKIRLFSTAPLKFSEIRFEFHTADTVTTGLYGIFKHTEVAARLQSLDPDGNVIDINATSSGNLRTTDAENGLAIAKGDVLGTTFIHKFGNAPDFDTTDGFVTIWDGAEDGTAWELMDYVYSTTDDIDTCSSSSVADTQDIEVQGLDANYDIAVQTITLDGQNKVSIPTSLIRLFRLTNVNSTDLVGHVFCYVDDTTTGGVPDTASNIRAIIQLGNNQTLMSIFTIPAGTSGYMRDWYAAISGAKKTSVHTVRVEARPFGQVFQLKHQSSILAAGSSSIQHFYTEPEIFLEKTDIEIRVNSDEDQASVSAGFDIVLVEN